ncbi:MAG: hypothetical protein HY287_01860 [Planctomycetes bacterium]|nr:hypothetical protein [Planctomycetota bacterium]MBI3833055.1 hypothetical protein [Planctomycetota bacterium]
MLTAKFDPTTFFVHVEHIALCVPVVEIFSVLKRAIKLPPQWAALVTRNVGDHVFVSAGGNVESQGAESVLFVRCTPLDLPFDIKGLRSRDGYTCDATARTSVVIHCERSEFESFKHAVLGSHRVVHIPRLTAFLQPTVQDALTNYCSAHDAEALTRSDGHEAETALAQALSAIGFESGLSLQGPLSIRFHSTAWGEVHAARERASTRRAQDEAHRGVEESQQNARIAHVEKLQSLLDRLREMQNEHPASSMPELIKTFSERQRGELYATLFAEAAATTLTKWIVVIAGDEVLYFHPSDLSSPSRRLRMNLPVGALRSVQLGDDGSFWIGAATGVCRLPQDRAEPDIVLTVPGAKAVRGGFNSVAASGDQVWAAHSELGIIRWNMDAPRGPIRLFEQETQSAKATRDIRQFDGQLSCGIDREIISWPADAHLDTPPQTHSGSESAITAVCPTDFGVIAGNADGDVLHWQRVADSSTDPKLIHRGMKRAVESVWMITTHGVPRLVFTDTSARVHVRIWGDNFSSQYEAGGQTLRRVEVADDLLIATNELRDRLICWTTGRPDKPPVTIPISRLTGHAIQDVCLVPERLSAVVHA